MTRYRVLITGSRSWRCHNLAEHVVANLLFKHGPALLVVHGDCPTGVDAAFKEACIEAGVEHEPHPADWDGKGKGAGPIRNSEMVARGADVCLAFSPNLAESRGTADCVRKAIAAGIPTWLTTSEEGRPTRLKEVLK